MFEKLVCHFRDHDFEEFSDHTKRRCRRCKREEWLFSTRYPMVGEPKYSWRVMDWHR